MVKRSQQSRWWSEWSYNVHAVLCTGVCSRVGSLETKEEAGKLLQARVTGENMDSKQEVREF